MTEPRTRQVQAVVFDIGNVLVEWKPESFFDGAIGPEARARLFAEVDLHGMNVAVDRGAPFRESVLALAARHREWEAEIRLWHDRWIEMFAPVIPGSVRLMRALRRRGIPVFALSNFGRESFALAEQQHEFLSEFDLRFISGHLGMMKPEPEIYARLEADCGLAAEALFFIDDRPENIAAAEARGWHGHLFATPERLAEALVAAGLLGREEQAA